jgi:hypothetical protein
MDIVNYIKSLHLHDSAVLSLSFDFRRDEILLQYNKYIEEIQDYSTQRLLFQNVTAVKTEDAFSFELTEISDVDIVQIDQLYRITITFLMGFGEPNWEISFLCKSVSF